MPVSAPDNGINNKGILAPCPQCPVCKGQAEEAATIHRHS